MKKGFTHESTYNESKEWYTPRFIFDALGIEFDLDPCSPGKDIAPWIPAKKHLTIYENGLITPWNGVVFMNPPYGMDTPKWFRRLALHGNGIGLVFARTDTKWFHEYMPLASALCFIKGRVQFIRADEANSYATGKYNPKGGCGAASILVAFGDLAEMALRNCGLGIVFTPVRDALSILSRHSEIVVAGDRFVSDKIVVQQSTACPHENSPETLKEGRANFFSKGANLRNNIEN